MKPLSFDSFNEMGWSCRVLSKLSCESYQQGTGGRCSVLRWRVFMQEEVNSRHICRIIWEGGELGKSCCCIAISLILLEIYITRDLPLKKILKKQKKNTLQFNHTWRHLPKDCMLLIRASWLHLGKFSVIIQLCSIRENFNLWGARRGLS